MTRRLFAFAALFIAAPLLAAEPDKPAEPTLSGPYTQGNLSVFLFHGKDTIPAGMKLLTLQEAIEQKKLIVHETSQVNELSVENASDDVEVFIQSGDIVKGGRQDRLMACDMLVPPKSGKLPIASFCCESGRWQQRGREAAGEFNSSNAQAGNKAVKVALNERGGDQGKVWEKVKEAQQKLSMNVGKPVANPDSKTSYQLTLEDKDLLAKVAKYVDALKKIAEEKGDSIGFVIAINGKVEGAELYGSHALFLKLWPKLINGAAVDALTEFDEKKKFDAPTAALVETFLADAAKGKEKEVLAARPTGRGPGGRNPTSGNNNDRAQQAADPAPAAPAAPAVNLPPSRAKVTSIDNDKSIRLEARDRNDGRLLHRSYIAK
jgi:hypothetical protein